MTVSAVRILRKASKHWSSGWGEQSPSTYSAPQGPPYIKICSYFVSWTCVEKKGVYILNFSKSDTRFSTLWQLTICSSLHGEAGGPVLVPTSELYAVFSPGRICVFTQGEKRNNIVHLILQSALKVNVATVKPLLKQNSFMNIRQQNSC